MSYESRIRSSSYSGGTAPSSGSINTSSSTSFSKSKSLVRRLRSLTEHREMKGDTQFDHDNIMLMIPSTQVQIQSSKENITRSNSDSSVDLSASCDAENNRFGERLKSFDRLHELNSRFESKNSEFISEKEANDYATQQAYLRCRRNFKPRCSLPAILNDSYRYCRRVFVHFPYWRKVVEEVVLILYL